MRVSHGTRSCGFLLSMIYAVGKLRNRFCELHLLVVGRSTMNLKPSKTPHKSPHSENLLDVRD